MVIMLQQLEIGHYFLSLRVTQKRQRFLSVQQKSPENALLFSDHVINYQLENTDISLS